MQKIWFIFIAFLSFNTVVQGLECYTCVYQDTNYPLYFDPILEHPSCQRGSIPEERLKVDCSELSFGGGGEGENVTYTCMDLSMDGLFLLSPIFTWNGTIRTCVASYKGDGSVFTEECLDGNLGKVVFGSSIPEIQGILQDFTGYFHSEATDAHVCNCNEELCNRDQ